MNLGLQNKIIIVTGGGSGIGAAIVGALAEEQAIPIIVGYPKEDGEKVKEDLMAKGHTAFAIEQKLGSPESCKKVIDHILDRHGRIDGLVNNAGVNDSVGLENGSPEAFLASLEKNLHHYYFMAHYALPSLKETKGNIVNISSKVAVSGQGGTSAYAAAKGGILGMTREWAAELLSYSIRVNAILPAEVMTPLYRKWLNQFEDAAEKEAAIVSRIPLEKRMTSPEEIAATTVFLLSEKSGHTTGQFLSVDGGYLHLDRALT